MNQYYGVYRLTAPIYIEATRKGPFKHLLQTSAERQGKEDRCFSSLMYSKIRQAGGCLHTWCIKCHTFHDNMNLGLKKRGGNYVWGEQRTRTIFLDVISIDSKVILSLETMGRAGLTLTPKRKSFSVYTWKWQPICYLIACNKSQTELKEEIVSY